MKIPVQITFHGIDHSDAVENRIRDRAEKLNQFYDRIISCRVVIGAPPRGAGAMRRKKDPFQIRIVVVVPGGELVVKRDGKEGGGKEDAAMIVREAFATMERQLSDFATRQRGEVKTRAAQ